MFRTLFFSCFQLFKNEWASYRAMSRDETSREPLCQHDIITVLEEKKSIYSKIFMNTFQNYHVDGHVFEIPCEKKNTIKYDCVLIDAIYQSVKRGRIPLLRLIKKERKIQTNNTAFIPDPATKTFDTGAYRMRWGSDEYVFIRRDVRTSFRGPERMIYVRIRNEVCK